MKTLKQQSSLSKKDILYFLIVPSILQFLFPHVWIDFFLLAIFYMAFTDRIFPYFFMIFLWGIIYSVITSENIGSEIIALTVVWYFYASFEEPDNFSLTIGSIATACLLYLIVKLCLSPLGCVWNIAMVIFFSLYFIAINVIIWLILMAGRRMFIMKKYPPYNNF